jgi:hypothetical protein
MGATTFETVASGKTAEEAFAAARDRARHLHGAGGYTGTIAEKHSFVMVSQTRMPREEARSLAERLIEETDPRVDDKWGPAGCIRLQEDRFLFFGWASS